MDQRIRQIANALLEGEDSPEAKALKESMEVHIGDPLKKLILHHLKDVEIPDEVKREKAQAIVKDFYTVIGPQT